MRPFREIKETSNSSIYRKLRKQELAKKEGCCTLCLNHRGENGDGYHGWNPSWKLISSNPKQYNKPKRVRRQVDNRRFSRFLCYCLT